MIANEQGFKDKYDMHAKTNITWVRGRKTAREHKDLLSHILEWAESAIAAGHLSTLGVDSTVKYEVVSLSMVYNDSAFGPEEFEHEPEEEAPDGCLVIVIQLDGSYQEALRMAPKGTTSHISLTSGGEGYGMFEELLKSGSRRSELPPKSMVIFLRVGLKNVDLLDDKDEDDKGEDGKAGQQQGDIRSAAATLAVKNAKDEQMILDLNNAAATHATMYLKKAEDIHPHLMTTGGNVGRLDYTSFLLAAYYKNVTTTAVVAKQLQHMMFHTPVKKESGGSKKKSKAKHQINTKFFGPTINDWDLDAKEFYADMTNKLEIIKFEGTNPEATNLGGVRYFPSLLGPQADKHRQKVLEEYKYLVQADMLQGWGEDCDADGKPAAELFKYLQKQIYQVRLPDGKYSLPFLKYVPSDVLEKMTPQKSAAWGPERPIDLAPTSVQKLFNHMLEALAIKAGFVDADNSTNVLRFYQAKKEEGGLGGSVYHFTLNFMGSHTLPHVDDLYGTGPGDVIYNMGLQQGGMLYFLHEPQYTSKNKGEPEAAMLGIYHPAGDCVAFTGDPRYVFQHGVWRNGDIHLLPTKDKCEGKDWGRHIRLVATMRTGSITKANQALFDKP